VADVLGSHSLFRPPQAVMAERLRLLAPLVRKVHALQGNISEALGMTLREKAAWLATMAMPMVTERFVSMLQRMRPGCQRHMLLQRAPQLVLPENDLPLASDEEVVLCLYSMMPQAPPPQDHFLYFRIFLVPGRTWRVEVMDVDHTSATVTRFKPCASILIRTDDTPIEMVWHRAEWDGPAGAALCATLVAAHPPEILAPAATTATTRPAHLADPLPRRLSTTSVGSLVAAPDKPPLGRENEAAARGPTITSGPQRARRHPRSREDGGCGPVVGTTKDSPGDAALARSMAERVLEAANRTARHRELLEEDEKRRVSNRPHSGAAIFPTRVGTTTPIPPPSTGTSPSHAATLRRRRIHSPNLVHRAPSGDDDETLLTKQSCSMTDAEQDQTSSSPETRVARHHRRRLEAKRAAEEELRRHKHSVALATDPFAVPVTPLPLPAHASSTAVGAGRRPRRVRQRIRRAHPRAGCHVSQLLVAGGTALFLS
jgi:hypothetical protein